MGSDLACSRDSADAAVQLLATAAERIGEGATTGRAICAMVQVRDSFETRRMARLVAAAVEGHPLAVDALERITRGAIGLVLPLVSRQNEGARLRLFEEL